MDEVERYRVSRGPAGAEGVYLGELYSDPFVDQPSAYTIDSLRFYMNPRGKYHYY